MLLKKVFKITFGAYFPTTNSEGSNYDSFTVIATDVQEALMICSGHIKELQLEYSQQGTELYIEGVERVADISFNPIVEDTKLTLG